MEAAHQAPASVGTPPARQPAPELGTDPHGEARFEMFLKGIEADDTAQQDSQRRGLAGILLRQRGLAGSMAHVKNEVRFQNTLAGIEAERLGILEVGNTKAIRRGNVAAFLGRHIIGRLVSDARAVKMGLIPEETYINPRTGQEELRYIETNPETGTRLLRFTDPKTGELLDDKWVLALIGEGLRAKVEARSFKTYHANANQIAINRLRRRIGWADDPGHIARLRARIARLQSEPLGDITLAAY